MNTITKEQAKDLRNAFNCWQQDYDPAEDKMQYDMFGLGMVAMDALLASLEAKPVAWTDEQELRDVEKFGCAYLFTVNPITPNADQRRVIKLYTAPPAPVSVPTFDEWLEIRGNKPLGWVKDAMRESYDACRAAMLQGAENAESPSSNSPVIPVCSCGTCRPVTFTDSRFVVCSECGNKRCPHANDHRNACTGSNEPGQEGSAYPAAPQQEVK